jgi:dipeptidase E
MPLLLASTFQHFKGLNQFHDFLSKAKVACITTAALAQIDDNPDRPAWMTGEIEAIQNLSKDFFEYDLRGKTSSDLENDLLDCDLIYFIGGNTYCLLEAANCSGYREFAPKFLGQGKSIWGGSAGAIIHCPDIDYIRSMDEPAKSTLTDYTGIGLMDLYLMPHWKGKHHAEAVQCIQGNPDIDIVCLTDDQAVHIDGNRIEIL